MADLVITITIPDAKVQKARAAFLSVYPNESADPTSPYYDPSDPNGMPDRRWVQLKTREWLRDIIQVGMDREHDAARPAPDPDVVT